SNNCFAPTFRPGRIGKRDGLSRFRARCRSLRTGQPFEKLSKRQPFEPEWFAACTQLSKDIEIRPLHSNTVKNKILCLFTLLNLRSCGLPFIRRATIGDEEKPGARVRHTVCLVKFLAGPQHVDSLTNRRPHWSVTPSVKSWWMESLR